MSLDRIYMLLYGCMKKLDGSTFSRAALVVVTANYVDFSTLLTGYDFPCNILRDGDQVFFLVIVGVVSEIGDQGISHGVAIPYYCVTVSKVIGAIAIAIILTVTVNIRTPVAERTNFGYF